MTKEDVVKWSKEIEAFGEGKEIQVYSNGKWRDTLNPYFDKNELYRIKPTKKYNIVMERLCENSTSVDKYVLISLEAILKGVYGDE